MPKRRQPTSAQCKWVSPSGTIRFGAAEVFSRRRGGVAAISLSPGSAQAFVVTVDGVQYAVTKFTGGVDNNSNKFNTAANGGLMSWWSDQTLATAFLSTVAGSLGYPNNGNAGPLFSWVCSSPICYSNDYDGTNAQANLYTDAAPAPAPLRLFGAAAAFGFSRKLRKLIKLS